MGDYIPPAPDPKASIKTVTKQLHRGFQAADVRAEVAAAVRHETIGIGPYTARCLVGGCGWYATEDSTMHLTVLAELHRRLHHGWVAVGRCHSLA